MTLGLVRNCCTPLDPTWRLRQSRISYYIRSMLTDPSVSYMPSHLEPNCYTPAQYLHFLQYGFPDLTHCA